MFAFPGHQAMDLTGPADILVLTNNVSQTRGMKATPYEIAICALEKGLVRANGGVVRIFADDAVEGFSDADLADVDTFVIAGGAAAIQLRDDPKVMDFTDHAASLCGTVATICTGAFLLANTGLLSGHSVATHWWSSRQLDQEHPDLLVNSDAIIERSGRFWNSGGLNSGIDLALAMVKADLGADISRAAARLAVVYLTRPGGQMQFSAPQDPKSNVEPDPLESRITEITIFITSSPATDLRRGTLWERFNLTERTLARRVDSFTGAPLSHLVEDARMHWAQLHLESSDERLETIATLSGFKSADTMRRVFNRRISVTPTEYRGRFQSDLATDGFQKKRPDGDVDNARCPETSDFCPSSASAE